MNKLSDLILDQVAQKKITAVEAMHLLNEIKGASGCAASQEFAIVGMACRLPQADTPMQFWDNLIQKRDAVDNFPLNRIKDVKYVNKQTHEAYKNLKCRVGTYLNRIDLFDHTYFGLTPAETRVMDPSQRIFLETAVEALEDAGLTEEVLKGSKTGVYVGYSINDDNYIDILSKDDPNIALGNQPSVLAYRLSFLFDLRGPTMIIDTACSSSLVAVHQACQAIAMGDCDQAIVGGVNIRLFPAIREINNLGIEAYDGRCRTFDEKASGTNIGDGVAALIIKRKDLAERDGDYIHAVIKGSAVNSDGSSNGITAPNPDAQAAVIVEAWKKAGIDPEKINFVETHGTGTKLGDPIEVLGLTNAFKEFTNKKNFCALGAVKTNIGHLEATSGLAGLIKAVMCLEKRQLPANIHYSKPNPFIDFENAPVFVNAELKSWAHCEQKLLGAVSSFGISGTNCHIVVEEYPQTQSAEDTARSLFFVSAKNEESLKGLLAKYADFLLTTPYTFADICYSSAAARNHYSHRLVIAAANNKELREKIVGCLGKAESLARIAEDDIWYTIQQQTTEWVCPTHLDESHKKALKVYLQGGTLDWRLLYGNKCVRKVPLPTYAFLPKRHWPKLEVEADGEEQRLQSICYGMKWIQEAHTPTPNDVPPGKYLFFVGTLPAHEQFYELAAKRGVEGIRVYQGDAFKQVSDTAYTIDPREPDHYDRLLEAASIGSDLEGVVHMWDCLPSSTSMDSLEGIVASQTGGTFCSYHLIRAFKHKYIEPSIKFVTLTAYAYQVGGEDRAIDPSKMPSLGINKVISQEFPMTSSVAIDLDIDHYDESNGRQLFSDIFESKGYKDAVVAFRGGKRFVQIIERLNLDNLKTRQATVRANGVYVIAGGTGYLGMQTALLLSRKAPVKIALLSRRPASALTDKHQKLFDEIKNSGSEICFIQADITDPVSCKQAIERVKEQLGSINGVFVANKNISHQRLDEVSFDFFSHNILSKLRGVWLLDSLTADQSLDFMATFSSISSLTGGPTGADCCASNLFLDSYGDYRNRLGKSTITMNYTLIEADDGSLLSDRMSMIPPLTKEEFVQTLDIFLTKELDFAAMCDFDSRVMTLVLPFMKLRFSEELLSEFAAASQNVVKMEPVFKLQKTASGPDEQIPFEDIQAILKKIWMDVLGYTELEATANFFEIGGDSISAVKLMHLIKVQLQVEISVSDLYSYPVLQDLGTYINQKLNGADADQSIKRLLESLDSGAVDLESVVNLIK